MADHICIESDSTIEALALRLRERSQMQHILLAGNRRSMPHGPGPPRPHEMNDWESCHEPMCREDREATWFLPSKTEATTASNPPDGEPVT